MGKYSLRFLALGYLGLILIGPLAMMVLRTTEDLDGAWAAISNPDTIAAFKLTLTVAAIAVAVNTVFGIVCALLIVRGDIPGRGFLNAFVDLPLSLSPVIVGFALVTLYGLNGWFGWFQRNGYEILFATPSIVLATIFVSVPFVAREVIPLMQSQGTQDEEAALSLGASGWRTFFAVTVPNVMWGLVYGVLLCNARAMGEFGAVSVVSGHIRGETNTMPLHIEILYNEYNFAAAFAVASLLAGLALLTLAVKSILEWRYGDALAGRGGH